MPIATKIPLRVVLIGPHGAGKSTLGKALAPHLSAACLPEIGRLHREQALKSGRHVLTHDPEFDRRVIEDELRRDLRAPAHAIIETWHPGNLAYAQRRSPEVARRLGGRVRAAALALSGVVVVPVSAPDDVLASRLTDPGGTAEARLQFFAAVARDAIALCHRWGLRMLPAVDTSVASPRACAEAVLSHLLGGGTQRPTHGGTR